MNLFPKVSYQKLVSKTSKTPKLSFGMGKTTLASKLKIPKTIQPKTPSSSTLKSFDSSKFMGPTAGQRTAAFMVKSIKAPKLAVVKKVIAKLKKN